MVCFLLEIACLWNKRTKPTLPWALVSGWESFESMDSQSARGSSHYIAQQSAQQGQAWMERIFMV
jgi:hypothetical protein